MKISSITLSAFRSHLKTAITDLSSVNIFVGPNGAGKTTILDAISYALTGVCRGVDDGGRGAEALASQLPDSLKTSTSVSLKTDRGDIHRGLGQGPRSQAHVKIVGKLGMDEKVLRVLAAPLNLLRLDRRKQEEVFFSLTGSSLTGEAVKQALVEAGAERPGLDYNSLATPDGRADSLKFYKQRRVEIKRAVAGLVFVPSDKKLADFDSDRLAKLQMEVSNDQRALSGQRGAAEAFERGAGHLKSLLSAAKEKLKALHGEKVGRDVLESAQVAAIRASLEHRRLMSEGLATERAGCKAMLDEIRNLSAEANRIRKFGAECPECGQTIDPSYTEHRVQDIMRAHQKASDEFKALEAKCRAIEQDINLTDPNALLDRISRSERAVQELNRVELDRQSLIDQIKDLSARLDGMKPPEVLDQSEVEAELARKQDAINELLESKSELEREVRVNQERGALEAELEQIERLVQALGPGGVIQQMMASDGTAALVGSVKEYGRALGVGEISIAFGPWGIFLNGRPIELASASEEFRVAAAFGIAFAVQAKASILCLDGAEILFGDFRSQFQDLVFSCGLEQVFVACTVDAVPESIEASTNSGLAMYAVQKDANGQSSVSPIKQEVVA